MMKQPLVSVCVPNLNTRPYLQERIDTILGQTYSNWELVISDNFSQDGSWEFFETLARQEPRVTIAQAPREGLYANWNRCIERARGQYVYIATSDDTMAPDCLEKMVAALERHKDCDLAHCPLVQIDEVGAPAEERWPDCTCFRARQRGIGAPTSRKSGTLPWASKSNGTAGLHLDHATAYTSVVVFAHWQFSIQVGIDW